MQRWNNRAELEHQVVMLAQQGVKIRVIARTLGVSRNTVRAILKDARMREQAHVIQTEIGKMMEDVVRLDKRVGNLGSHFEQARKDIADIQTSTGKIVKRGEAIESIQLEPAEGNGTAVAAPRAQPQRELLQ